jgi:hypothetical protein
MPTVPFRRQMALTCPEGILFTTSCPASATTLQVELGVSSQTGRFGTFLAHWYLAFAPRRKRREKTCGPG